jgi:hypothetical protein
MIIKWFYILVAIKINVPSNSSKNPKMGPKAKQQNNNKVEAHFLICNTLGVRRHVGVLGWD